MTPATVAQATGRPVTGLKSPLDPARRIRAVLFDVDGTLYNQRSMRQRMAIELAVHVLRSPARGLSTVRALRVYRQAQETLREAPPAAGTQIEIAASRLGVDAPTLAPIVEEWMVRRPLEHMTRCSAPGLLGLLALLDENGVRAGVLSDYPAAAKLDALGLRGRFAPVLCADDVGVLKPNPQGFLAASAFWALNPSDVLVVGDRADADAAGAAAAGMPCVIVGADRTRIRTAGNVLVLRSLTELAARLAAA